MAYYPGPNITKQIKKLQINHQPHLLSNCIIQQQQLYDSHHQQLFFCTLYNSAIHIFRKDRAMIVEMLRIQRMTHAIKAAGLNRDIPYKCLCLIMVFHIIRGLQFPIRVSQPWFGIGTLLINSLHKTHLLVRP